MRAKIALCRVTVRRHSSAWPSLRIKQHIFVFFDRGLAKMRFNFSQYITRYRDWKATFSQAEVKES